MSSLSLEHICKTYPNGFEAVKDFNLEIEDKEFIIFVGPSGCGKSTTLRMIAGLEDISTGTLKIDDKVMNDVEPKDRDIAMVFQNYALYPHMTVYDNMAFGLKLRKVPKDEIDKAVRSAAKILDLEHLLLETSGDHSEIAAQLFLCKLSHIEQITKEKKTKAAFLKDVILGNIQPDMTASSARKMHVTFHTPRAVFLVQVPPEDLDLGLKFASAIFSPSSGSQCFAVSDSRFVIVRELAGTDSVSELAHQLADTMRAELMTPICVSTGSTANHLGELPQRFQEAVTALTISSIFTPDTYVSSYDRLGLGRLIYTLKPEVCRTFLQETFGAENPLNDLAPDTYELINGTRKPGRDKVILLGLAAELTVKEVQRALEMNQLGILYARNRRDSILIFALQNHLSPDDTQDLLLSYQEPALT